MPSMETSSTRDSSTRDSSTAGPTNTPINTPIPPTSTNTPAPGTSTGFLSPSANAAQTSNAGDNNGYETSPTNAYANDSSVAADTNSGTNKNSSCTNNGKDKHHYYNYNFNIPATAVIQGIQVRLDARADGTGGSPKICVQLSWDGGSTWTRLSGNGLPAGDMGRIGLSVYRKDPRIIYASIDARLFGFRHGNQTPNGAGDLYRGNFGFFAQEAETCGQRTVTLGMARWNWMSGAAPSGLSKKGSSTKRIGCFLAKRERNCCGRCQTKPQRRWLKTTMP